MFRTILLFLLSILAACSSARLLMPTQADVDRGAVYYSGLTIAELAEGKTLYENHCGQCHALHDPALKSKPAWEAIVPVMAKKVNKKEGQGTIDSMKQEIILHYLVTMHNAGK